MNIVKRTSILGLALLALAGCKPAEQPAKQESAASVPTVAFATNDIVVGTGEPIKAGQVAVVHYTGWLYDAATTDHRGKKFDSSRDHGAPFRFPLGGGSVIKGWDEGVAGMKVGGQRELIVPAELGYGDQGAGSDIPPGATLLFNVELLAIE